jgi:hypothetical protein
LLQSIRDKENILRHATSNKQMKQAGVFVTEDFSSKKVTGKSSKGPGSPSKTVTLVGSHWWYKGMRLGQIVNSQKIKRTKINRHFVTEKVDCFKIS